MQAILAILAQVGLRLLTTGVAERVLLTLARELAQRTTSPIDDQIVDAVEAALGHKPTPPPAA